MNTHAHRSHCNRMLKMLHRDPADSTRDIDKATAGTPADLARQPEVAGGTRNTSGTSPGPMDNMRNFARMTRSKQTHNTSSQLDGFVGEPPQTSDVLDASEDARAWQVATATKQAQASEIGPAFGQPPPHLASWTRVVQKWPAPKVTIHIATKSSRRGCGIAGPMCGAGVVRKSGVPEMDAQGSDVSARLLALHMHMDSLSAKPSFGFPEPLCRSSARERLS